MTVPVVAVDFGATSVRIGRIDVAAAEPVLEIIHRVAHHPRSDPDGTLRWDWARLVAEMERGLERALSIGPVASIGIDTWGVDYGLVGEAGELIEPPISYRDTRTSSYRDVVERVGAGRLYDIAGLQLMPINTIFQVAAHDPDSLARARHLVMLPELLAHHLTGSVTAEVTSAGTTGLLDLATGDWSDELAEAVALPGRLLPPLQRAGWPVGMWRGIPVHLVGGHDTASAVLGGAVDGASFVSTGTWLLVGRVQPEPDTTDWARRGRFTNEQGAHGGIRLLRNVAGWWLVEECRRIWGGSDRSDRDDLDDLLDAAAAIGPVPIVDATDERFLRPADMPAELVAAAGLGANASRPEIVRCAIESMAAAAATIAVQLDRPSIRIFGGGIRAGLFAERLHVHSGLCVSTGPVEATALGNAISQSLALGVFDDVTSARQALSRPTDELTGEGR